MTGAFKWSLIFAGVIWSIFVLPVESLRSRYSGVTGALASGSSVNSIDRDNLISEFRYLASFGICLPGFREQLAAFLVDRARSYRRPGEVDQAQRDLREAEHVLSAMLACSPLESNQWLSLAVIDMLLNSVREKAFKALRLSYLTDPRELWVVERRLDIALRLVTRLPEHLLQHAKNDINVLKSAHPSDQASTLKKLNINSIEELEELFS